jgi:hypothetical protein
VPTVNVLGAEGWPAGLSPIPADGLAVDAFATGLEHPRWIYTLPNGDILVAETNAPERPDDNKSLKGRFMKLTMKHTGAAVPSPNRITLLRDGDGDGRAEVKQTFLQNLSSPFGMALVGNTLYVANSDAVVRFPYRSGETSISAPAEKVTDLPAGTINHHWTKNIVASPDGWRLYASVGSNSNAAENGIEAEQGRAAIWEINLTSGDKREFASGLRNPVGMGWEPGTRSSGSSSTSATSSATISSPTT